MTSATADDRHVHVEHVMGTVVSFDVRGVPAGLAREVVGDACRDLHRIDRTFSTYRAGSAICRIDRGELDVRDAAPDVRWVLERCEQLRLETRGAFDARATGQLDPSALVKGWAVQRASDHLLRSGLRHHCVNGGGDIVVSGSPDLTTRWRVGIQHPLDPASIAAIVEAPARGAAIATSGLYERGGHIVTPEGLRRPVDASAAPADACETPSSIASVTITGPDLALADAYATAAFAMGDDGPAWTTTLAGYEAMTIRTDGRVLRTRDFPLAADDSARAPGASAPVDPQTIRRAA